MTRSIKVTATALSIFALAACSNLSDREQRTLSGGAIGAAGGAAIGALVGGSATMGAIIGGAAGAATGAFTNLKVEK